MKDALKLPEAAEERSVEAAVFGDGPADPGRCSDMAIEAMSREGSA